MNDDRQQPGPDTVGFDPTKHLTKVSGRDYLEVKWRLVWFHEVHPDGSVETDLIEHRNNAAVFRCRVSWPTETGIVIRSGWGQEDAGDFAEYLEKAETKAIGRALAAAGFGTQFCEDLSFGGDHGRVVDAPVHIRGADGPRQRAPQEATPRQVTYLRAVAREVGLTADDLDARSQEVWGRPVAELGRREISSLIEQLQAERPVPGLATQGGA